MEPLLRLRLKFLGGQILSKSQKFDGLKRSWVLLKPQHETVSDVALHILHAFDLYDSCPYGLILSKDGFVLPPSQPLNILKDGDLICVKRRQAKLADVIKEPGHPNTSVDKSIDEQPSGMKLLTNTEFANEMGGYASDNEVEEEQQSDESHQQTTPNRCGILKKRKASKELKSSTKKKLRKLSPEHDEVSRHMKEISCTSRSARRQKKLSKKRNEDDGIQTPEVSKKKPEKKGDGALTSCAEPGKPMRGGRSSRRKRRKRQWLQMKKLEERQINEREINGDMGSKEEEKCKNTQPEEEIESEEEINGDVGSKEDEKCKNNQPEEEIESEEEIVPVTIRPGHICFAPSGKVTEIKQSIAEKEPYQWKGILGKRKGQKWGQETLQSGPKLNKAKQDKDRNFTEDVGGWEKPSSSGWDKQKASSRWNEYKPPNRNYSNGGANWKVLSVNNRIDFEKLVPLTDNPVEGDTLAYRLLVLSSSFCPELSSYRIGKVSSFDPQSKMVKLVPVPEYPFDFEKKTDNEENVSEELPSSPSAFYRDDGSIEIDFPSLADVRIVKLQAPGMGNATPVTKVTPSSWTAVTRQTPAKPVFTTTVAAKSSVPENGNKDVWDEISEAISAKKAQLQETKWPKASSRNNRSWSNRTLQGGAVGPTMALLRAENGS